MAEIERVIEELQEQVDLCKEYFQRVDIFKDKSELEKLALKISVDGMQTLDVAIQTIRELQSQIPKWHLVADNDFPPIRKDILIVLKDGDMSTGYLSDDYFYVDCISKKYVEIKNVIAWTELPKFEGVE